MMKLNRIIIYAVRALALCVVILVIATLWDVQTPSLSLKNLSADSGRFQVLDRRGVPLGISYQNAYNTAQILPLHAIPEQLRQAFVTSEDRHFFEHNGVDWNARLQAIRQNIRAKKAVRGASTITEQVVRIIHPRPRTIWSRWVEGFEAMLLEARATKGDILEFYLNQVPYAANRRGIAQAARYYFNRDVDTLTHKEMLALAVLPRAPSALDLYRSQEMIEPGIARLADAMQIRGEISAQEVAQLKAEPITLEQSEQPLNSTHFINYIRETVPYRVSDNGKLVTTLDATVQSRVQNLLEERLKALSRKHVQHGAAMVVDPNSGEILAWVVAASPNTKTGQDIDAVRVPRQPGSSLKPFLYALALDSGWSPATIMDDAPMAEAIGTGLHDFHNYSRTFYGKISLREALGNSLNIPALETIGFVTPSRYLDTLHALNFESLTQPVEFYKEGLALGNGEVTLYEMMQGYAAIANRGVFRQLTPLPQPHFTRENRRVYSAESASLIGNILSDPFARRREFGTGSVLNLPVQTAVKTGTSSDYHDAWVFGYNSRFLVGVWLGNLDQSPMDGVTGSTGPALVMRGIFAGLNEGAPASPLYMSPKLSRKEICANGDELSKNTSCYPHTEYFIAGSEPKNEQRAVATKGIALVRPTEGLQIAYDPRIKPEHQAFEFVSDGIPENHTVEWLLNDKPLATTKGGRYLWPVQRGKYTLTAREIDSNNTALSTDLVHFHVK